MSRSRKTSVSVVLGGKVGRVFRMPTGYISAEELGQQYGYKPKPNDSMQKTRQASLLQRGQPGTIFFLHQITQIFSIGHLVRLNRAIFFPDHQDESACCLLVQYGNVFCMYSEEKWCSLLIAAQIKMGTCLANISSSTYFLVVLTLFTRI